MREIDKFFNLPYFTGESLDELAEKCKEPRKPIIDGLIYEDTGVMFFADDGIGKSLLTFQIICEASVGLPVFGYFQCPKPVRTLWCQMERHPRELGERYKKFSSVFKPSSNNIILTTKLQGLDIKKESDWKKIMDIIHEIILTEGDVNLIVFDPIYCMVSGDLSEPATVAYVNRFSQQIQNIFNVTTLFITHSNRGIKIQTGKLKGQRTQGDFFGSRFLRAHFSTVYHISRRSDGGFGSHWKLDKDSIALPCDEFFLDFDQESFLSRIDPAMLDNKERVANVLRQWETSGREFTNLQLSTACQLPSKVIENLRLRDMKLAFKDSGKRNGISRIYTSEISKI